MLSDLLFILDFLLLQFSLQVAWFSSLLLRVASSVFSFSRYSCKNGTHSPPPPDCSIPTHPRGEK
ncbi:hypothetical protein BDV98DRAFT_568284 [Pterulicium gracile]|uniref:Uncharacterized protein n=1 Tax=Pterulicium gracile TaxID=1884261 RepID=A0A5C3QG76_9AGAR|nr:hypothetical protein BDV98DRAFT_568284 [Pterula gracilis]